MGALEEMNGQRAMRHATGLPADSTNADELWTTEYYG
jgi:hypothetical protein